jgi:hypothetical protein
MIHLFALFLVTFNIVLLTSKIWKATKSWCFVVGICCIYYWSLMGSWFVCIDLLNNNMLQKYGLHYYHIYDLLFEVKLDYNYLMTISLYGLFIIIFQIMLLYLIKSTKSQMSDLSKNTLTFNSINATVIAIACLFLSFAIEFEDIMYAIKFGDSIYTVTRNSSSKFYTFHQLANQVSILIIFFAFILILRKSSDENNVLKIEKKYNWLVITTLIIVILYLTSLGNKHELFTAGIFSIVYFMHDRKLLDKRNLNLLWLIPFFVLPLMFNDPIRALLPKIINSIMNVDEYNLSPNTIAMMRTSGYGSQNVSEISNSAFYNMVFSNEMFYAQFSLYGILLFKMPYMMGASLISLFSSFIPKVFGLTRSMDAYTYYSIMAHTKEGQGYTINHIAAWYLNFGIFGIVLGAVVLAYFFTINNWFLNRIKNNKINFLLKLSPFLMASFIPNLIRTGPEGYKSVIFEGLLIPMFFILICLKKEKIKLD